VLSGAKSGVDAQADVEFNVVGTDNRAIGAERATECAINCAAGGRPRPMCFGRACTAIFDLATPTTLKVAPAGRRVNSILLSRDGRTDRRTTDWS